MKQNKQNTKQNRVYMMRTALVLITIAFLFGVVGGFAYFSKSVQSKTYTSEFMKVQFRYPANYTVQEKQNNIYLSKGEQKIRVGKSGSNFTRIDEHVDLLISTHKDAKVLERKNFELNGLNSVSVLLDLSGSMKYEYFLLNNYAIYQFETNNPALFSDLDEIVRTFRITGSP